MLRSGRKNTLQHFSAKRPIFDKFYCVRNPIALLHVEHHEVNTDAQEKKKNMS